MELNKIYHGKMEEVLKDFPDNYFDSIVTDPPYGLSFMNKHWDYNVPTIEQWKEAYRTLKPGGFLLSFGGTRTYHRMVVNIEDAGFEIRDQIQWLYGSGFPKSLDIGKAIDKQAGVERNVIGTKNVMNMRGGALMEAKPHEDIDVTEATSDEAKQWEGWGTALKPANEPICVARKPVEGTVANNVLKYGTGGINIDGCRITTDDNTGRPSGIDPGMWAGKKQMISETNSLGRFPANVILDEFMGEELDKQSGVSQSVKGNIRTAIISNATRLNNSIETQVNCEYDDLGGASRFFYCPKPDNFERNKGLKNFEKGEPPASARSKPAEGRENALGRPRANHHPTVKPIDLMRYLVRLVTKKGGICLDPFCGSGTTLIGAKMELMNYVGIDMDASHIPLSEARVAAWNPDKYKEQTLF